MDETALCRMELSGRPGQITFDPADPDEVASQHGLLGIDVAARSIDGVDHTVVQLLLDDDRPGFDPSLLDGPLVAELLGADLAVTAREPFDHDSFRRRLQRERAAGTSTLRGVLVLTEGKLPPPWIRLAFLPVALSTVAGSVLVVRRTTVLELVDGADRAEAEGLIDAEEHRAMLISIEQRYPDSL